MLQRWFLGIGVMLLMAVSGRIQHRSGAGDRHSAQIDGKPRDVTREPPERRL